MMPLDREATLCRMSRALARVAVLDDIIARHSAYMLAGVSCDDILDLDASAVRIAETYRTRILPLANGVRRENRTGT
jgi:hypothetical protein